MRSLVRRSVVVSVAGGILVGLVLESWMHVALLVVYSAALLSLIILVWMWRDARVRLMMFGVCAIAIGIMRMHAAEQASQVGGGDIRSTWSGVIRSEVVRSDRSQSFSVIVDDEIRSTMRVVASPLPEFRYGDWVSGVCGSVTEDGACVFPTVHRLGSGRGNPIRQALLSLRSSLTKRISEMVPQPESGIVSAYVLGDQQMLSTNMREVFRRTGTSHIVAISGAHMVILTQIVLILLHRFPLSLRQTGVSALAILSLFTLLIGAPASAVRGFLFSTILIGAWVVGRLRVIGHTLLVGAVMMILVYPRWLFDLGFQLSFLATAGLVYIVPILLACIPEHSRQALKRHSNVSMVVEAALASMAAIIATTPLVLATIGRTSIVALPANVMVAPALTPLLLVALIAIPLLYVPFLGLVASVVVTAAFGAFRLVVEGWAHIPGVFVEMNVTPLMVGVAYLVCIVLISYLWFRFPWIQKLSVGQRSGSS